MKSRDKKGQTQGAGAEPRGREQRERVSCNPLWELLAWS